jgi:altronate hydrolase
LPKPPAVLILNPKDNVAIALRPLRCGEVIEVEKRKLKLTEAISFGHKVAFATIKTGQPIYKYGEVIGNATQPISPGNCVHSHNLVGSAVSPRSQLATHVQPPLEPIDASFDGYVRPGGKVGTRNYLAVISTVNCSATVSRRAAKRFDEEVKKYPNLDGVFAFTHHGGCGIPFAGLSHQHLTRMLGGLAKHANIGGFVLVGLGCEQNSIGYLMTDQNLIQIEGLPRDEEDRPIIPVLSIQDAGGTQAATEAVVAAIADLMPRVADVKRQSVPASHLIVGTECGGSDAASGITANPAIGLAADKVVAAGGTAILSETSEIYGAEHLLTRRAVSTTVAEKLLERIAWWKSYASFFGGDLDGNPSVGNKAGGLTTIAEKSLGAISKAGSTALVDVLPYAAPVQDKGMVIMDTPGFDPSSVAGMIGGGANVIVFSTGRGSCFGSKPAPTIKVASNTPMYERLETDMDINAGTVLTGANLKEVGDEIFQMILDVASGKHTKSENLGIGDEEFIPWIPGPQL